MDSPITLFALAGLLAIVAVYFLWVRRLGQNKDQ